MTWEVLRDDTTLNKIINIELHLESAHNDELSLSTIELLKEISGIAFELRVAVIDTHATFDLKQLTHHIDHDVVKVHHDYDLVLSVVSIKSRVEHSTRLAQTVKRRSHDTQTFLLDNEAVVRICIKGKLFFLRQHASLGEEDFWVVNVKVF